MTKSLKQIAADIDAFVAQADYTINLLNGPAPSGIARAKAHARRVDAALDAYEKARLALTGEREPEEPEE